MAHTITDSYVACGTCIDEYPVGVISKGDIYSIDADTCVDCDACVVTCPSGAIGG